VGSTFGPPTGATGTLFGRAVSTDGDTALIGAPSASTDASSAGEAWVYAEQNATSWRSRQRLKSSTPVSNGQFGIDTVLVEDRAVVGALNEGANSNGTGTTSGAVHVFRRMNGTGGFTHVQRLVPPSPTSGQAYGFGLSASGDWLAVGSYNDDQGGTDAGAVFLYEWSDATTSYVFRQKLVASDPIPNQKFGVDTAMADDVLLIGAYRDGTGGEFEVGSAYVFTRGSSGTWTQSQKLRSSPVSAGAWFGDRLDMTPGRMVITASKESVSGAASGAAYVFKEVGGSWVQEARLGAPPGSSGAWFGSAVAASGATAIIGGRGVTASGVSSGSAFRQGFGSSGWSLAEPLPPAAPVAGSNYGMAVDRAGGIVLIGAPNGAGRVTLLARTSDCDGDGADDDSEMDAGGDCNANLVLDACEIASGAAADCNGNGLPDSCDVASGLATDVDGNGVLDSCEGYALSVPGEFATLQAAIDAIPQGSTATWNITLGSGIFAGGSTGGRNIAIQGASTATTVLEGSFGSTVLDANDGGSFWYGSTGSITLRDLTIRGGSKGAMIAGYASVLVERCRFEGCFENGLAVAGTWPDQVAIVDCHAILCGTGFAVAGMAAPDLDTCIAEQCERGFYLNGNSGYPQPDSVGSVLVDCEATNNFLVGVWVPSGEYAAAIGGEFTGTTVGRGIDAAWGFQLSNAIVSGNGNEGLSAGGDFYYYRTTIANCTFANNGVAGVEVTDASDFNQFKGPSITGSTFSGNPIGVRVSAAGTTSGAATITDCSFVGSTAISVSMLGVAS
ncbi:MAG: hypothetical protein FJ257_13005, partial [Phycisphaerae bacterium]|nr:hypothetical protein [Phycisphaerae bacterium]